MLMSAGFSSSSNVRGQVSHSKLQRLVISRYRHTGGASACLARLDAICSKYRRGLRTPGSGRVLDIGRSFKFVPSEKGKQFFFEKKNQKTFAYWGAR
jgi:hypothetical protein